MAVNSAGNILVADSFASYPGGVRAERVQVFDDAGSFRFKFGSNGIGDGQFAELVGIAVDTTYRIIIGDKRRIQVFDNTGNFIFTVGSSGPGDGQFAGRRADVAVAPNNRIIVSEVGSSQFPDKNHIQVFDSAGNFLFSFGSGGTEDGQLMVASHVAVDPASGNIIVYDHVISRIQIFDGSANFLFKVDQIKRDGRANR